MDSFCRFYSHSRLYALIGTTVGGNGKTTFGLPHLQGHSRLARQPDPACRRL
jgi:microcystin-dependent protein